MCAGGSFTAREELTTAIEGIVDAFVKLGDRRALEDLRSHRRRLAVDLKARVGGPYDFSRPIADVHADIVAIEAGLERLSAVG
jgi:hypothetical protein